MTKLNYYHNGCCNTKMGKFIKNKLPIVICQKGLIKLVDIRDDENNVIDIKFRSRFN